MREQTGTGIRSSARMTVPGELDALTADIFEALYRATTLLGIPPPSSVPRQAT